MKATLDLKLIKRADVHQMERKFHHFIAVWFDGRHTFLWFWLIYLQKRKCEQNARVTFEFLLIHHLVWMWRARKNPDRLLCQCAKQIQITWIPKRIIMFYISMGRFMSFLWCNSELRPLGTQINVILLTMNRNVDQTNGEFWMTWWLRATKFDN